MFYDKVVALALRTAHKIKEEKLEGALKAHLSELVYPKETGRKANEFVEKTLEKVSSGVPLEEIYLASSFVKGMMQKTGTAYSEEELLLGRAHNDVSRVCLAALKDILQNTEKRSGE